jgi:hypothetical protein
MRKERIKRLRLRRETLAGLESPEQLKAAVGHTTCSWPNIGSCIVTYLRCITGGC